MLREEVVRSDYRTIQQRIHLGPWRAAGAAGMLVSRHNAHLTTVAMLEKAFKILVPLHNVLNSASIHSG